METLFTQAVGLLATAILVTTLTAQTIKQWRERATKGIARWFFLGQVSASVCFIAYSLLVHSVLFAVANTLVLGSALAGYIVLRTNRRRALLGHRREAERKRRGATRASAPEVTEASAHLRVVVLG